MPEVEDKHAQAQHWFGYASAKPRTRLPSVATKSVPASTRYDCHVVGPQDKLKVGRRSAANGHEMNETQTDD